MFRKCKCERRFTIFWVWNNWCEWDKVQKYWNWVKKWLRIKWWFQSEKILLKYKQIWFLKRVSLAMELEIAKVFIERQIICEG